MCIWKKKLRTKNIWQNPRKSERRLIVPKNIPSTTMNSLRNQTHEPNATTSIDKVQPSWHLDITQKFRTQNNNRPINEKLKILDFWRANEEVPALGLIQWQHLCSSSSFQYCCHKTHKPSWILISQLSLPCPKLLKFSILLGFFALDFGQSDTQIWRKQSTK